jgi:hypothetical protein
MIKKLLAVAMFSVLPAAHACTVNFNTSNELLAVIKQNGPGWVSDEQCRLLKAASMKLSIAAQATVLNGISIGWVSVNVADDANVNSGTFTSNTSINSKLPGSMTLANRLMYEALGDSMRDFDVAKAISEVRENRRRLK